MFRAVKWVHSAWVKWLMSLVMDKCGFRFFFHNSKDNWPGRDIRYQMLTGLCPKPVFSVPCRVTARWVKCWPNGSTLLKVPFSYSIHLLFVKQIKPSKGSLNRIPTSLQTVRLLTEASFAHEWMEVGWRDLFLAIHKRIYIYIVLWKKNQEVGCGASTTWDAFFTWVKQNG